MSQGLSAVDRTSSLSTRTDKGGDAPFFHRSIAFFGLSFSLRQPKRTQTEQSQPLPPLQEHKDASFLPRSLFRLGWPALQCASMSKRFVQEYLPLRLQMSTFLERRGKYNTYRDREREWRREKKTYPKTRILGKDVSLLFLPPCLPRTRARFSLSLFQCNQATNFYITMPENVPRCDDPRSSPTGFVFRVDASTSETRAPVCACVWVWQDDLCRYYSLENSCIVWCFSLARSLSLSLPLSLSHVDVGRRSQLQERGDALPPPPRLVPGLEHLPHGWGGGRIDGSSKRRGRGRGGGIVWFTGRGECGGVPSFWCQKL